MNPVFKLTLLLEFCFTKAEFPKSIPVIVNVNAKIKSQPKWAIAGGCLITFMFTGKNFSSGTQLIVNRINGNGTYIGNSPLICVRVLRVS